jgi:predicted ATPase
MATEFKKGSEWRKWDLHVHTPNSIVHNYKSLNDKDVWDSYINDLESLPSDIKVLGINDYLFIDGYKKVLDYKKQGRLQNIELILPVVEFRLAKFSGNKQFKRINFHIIFSNEIAPEIIQSQFLNALSSSYKLDPNSGVLSWGGVIDYDNLEALGKAIKSSVPAERLHEYKSDIVEGFNNLNLELSDIQNKLTNGGIFFKDKYITAIGKTEWDAFSWDDGSIAEKKTIINGVDIVFTAAESIENFNKGKQKLKDSKVNDLLLDCSDSHNNLQSTDKDRLGNCFTWIKADPTFEGLKQILYEPEDRVKIQENRPEEKAGYHVIEKVVLNEDTFWKEELLFNSNLNTIIGGRSTGKSTLLQSIAKKIDTRIVNNDLASNDFVNSHLVSVEVVWQDGERNSARDIEFFPQSHMYKIAADQSELNLLVEKIVKSKDVNSTLARYNEFVGQNKLNISALVNEVFLLQASINAKKTELREKGDKNGIETEIKNLDAKIQNLKADANISDETLEQYRDLTKSIVERAETINQAEKDKTELLAIRDKSIFNESLFFDLIRLREATKDTIETSLKALIEETKEKWLRIIDLSVETLQKEIENTLLSIEKDKTGDIYKIGFQYFQINKEYSEIQKKIEEERKKFAIILDLEKQIRILNKQSDELIVKILDFHGLYLSEIESTIQKLHFDYDGIEITSKIKYRKDDLRVFLESRHNRRSLDNQGYYDEVINNYFYDLTNIVFVYLKSSLSGNIEYKGGHQANNVTNEFLSTNWFEIEFELKYQNDMFHVMSQGKQAFVILKLLLDFSDKKCPILIDQPEDSLDNRAIYNELVQYIKQKKKERQIILVTHNPNVVVSADSELVIVANQHGKDSINRDEIKFQYIEGSLESTKQKDDSIKIILESQGVREHVCEILEGGKEAFKKREEKYGFK